MFVPTLFSQTDWSSLAELAEAGRFNAVDESDIAFAEQRLAVSFQRLIQAVEASPINVDGWRQFIANNKLSLKFDRDADPTPLLKILRQDRSGMDWGLLIEYRDALEEWKMRRDLLGMPTLQGEFEARRNLVSGLLSHKQRASEAQIQSTLARLYEWFDRRQQVPELANAVRVRSMSNNVSGFVSKAIIAAYVRDQFVRFQPVRDCILGTSISGSGIASGHSDVEVINDSSRIHLSIAIQTCLRTDTVGVNGPVRIYSDGATSIETRKAILFDGHSIFTLPATSSAVSSSSTKGLSTKFSGLVDRLVKRIASKQIRKKSHEANAVAADHAERDTNKATDAEVAEMVRQGNASYYKDVVRPWSIRGLLPKHFDLSSDVTGIHFATLIAGDHKLGACTQSSLNPPRGDVQVHLHQSLINNILSSYLSGQKLNVDELKELSTKLPGSTTILNPNEKSASDPSTRKPGELIVTLDDETPVEVLFDDGVEVTIRARTLQIEEQIYSAMNVKLRFIIDSIDGKLYLRFDGNPIIAPPRLELDPSAKLSGPEVAVRRILRNMISKHVPSSTRIDGYPLERDQKVIGELEPRFAKTSAGWIAISADFLPVSHTIDGVASTTN